MKTFIKYSLLATSVLFFWFIFIICNVPNIWISELIVSFLPYIWIAYIGMLITLIIVFWVSKHKYNFYDVEYKDNKKIVYIHMLKASIILVIFLTFGYLTFNIYDFAFKKPDLNSLIVSELKNSIKIVTFNKLYTNNNVQEISDTFKSQNIDVIALSEVTEDDKIVFIEKLKDTYPYYYFTTSDVGFDNAIFSKYELTKKSETGTRKDLLLASFKKDEELFDIIIAHPNSPTSSTNMLERNKQLDELSKEIMTTKNTSQTDTNIIVVGDLNTTPWSPILKEFTSQNNHLYNALQGKGIRFTWQVAKSGINIETTLARAQIDHIFISKNMGVEMFNILPSMGSDHKPISITLKY